MEKINNSSDFESVRSASKPFNVFYRKPICPLKSEYKDLFSYNYKKLCWEIIKDGFCYRMQLSQMHSLKVALKNNKSVKQWFNVLDKEDKKQVKRIKQA